MTLKPCKNLDAYLLGHLEADGAIQFENHLAECEDCQHQVNLQTQIDHLCSHAPDLALDEFQLSQILDTLDVSLEQESVQKNRWSLTYSFAIAAVLLLGISLAISYAWFDTPPSNFTPDQIIAVQPKQPTAVPLTTEDTTEETEFVSPQLISHDKNHLAVVIETDDPDFSVIMFYPTVQTQTTTTINNR